MCGTISGSSIYQLCDLGKVTLYFSFFIYKMGKPRVASAPACHEE